MQDKKVCKYINKCLGVLIISVVLCVRGDVIECPLLPFHRVHDGSDKGLQGEAVEGVSDVWIHGGTIIGNPLIPLGIQI